MPTSYGMPMPGEKINDMTVIASTIFAEREDDPWEFTVLLLCPERPFYKVMVISQNIPGKFPFEGWKAHYEEDFDNIVPAVCDGYSDAGGDY